jgi:hypothetical protein
MNSQTSNNNTRPTPREVLAAFEANRGKTKWDDPALRAKYADPEFKARRLAQLRGTEAFLVSLPNGEQCLCPSVLQAENTAKARGGRVAIIHDGSIPSEFFGCYYWREHHTAEWQDWKYPTGDEVKDTLVPSREVGRLEVLATDYIEELAIELTQGTQVPQSFARETLKGVFLAALPITRPSLSFMPLHTRYYSLLLSETPGAGKGESHLRVSQVLNQARSKFPQWEALQQIKTLNGTSFGSPEYAVQCMGGTKLVHDDRAKAQGRKGVEGAEIIDGSGLTLAALELPRNLVHYDEGLQLLKKDAKQSGSSGLVTMFTSLFEFNNASTGSFKNGEYTVSDANASLSMHFVRSSFEEHFAGTGATSDGFLSRCVITSDKKNHVEGDWRVTDVANVNRLLNLLHDCAGRKSVGVTEDGNADRLEFLRELRTWDADRAGRLEFLFAQDLYLRAIYSPTGMIDEVQVARAAAWVRQQLAARLAIWPIDSGADKREAMGRLITKALEKHGTLSRREVYQAANVGRPGSGGPTVYDQTMRALLSSGVVAVVGKTRKGADVYAQVSES